MDHNMVPVRSMAVAHSTPVQVQVRNMALAAGNMARNWTNGV